MSRLIDADALMEDLKQSHDWLLKIYESLPFEVEKRVCSAEIATFNEIGLRIKAAPTIEAEPVRRGRWNHDGPRFKGGIDWYSCSVCGNGHAAEWMKYCCMCGARMDGGNENG